MKKIVDFFLSLKLTVVLLALSMVLVLAGTLAQVDKGIWTVVDQYFRCLIAWIDLPVFFPRSWDMPNIRITFPGGFLIGWLLVVNLITVHWASFKIQVNGVRRIAGLLVLLLGVIVTMGGSAESEGVEDTRDTSVGTSTPPVVMPAVDERGAALGEVLVTRLGLAAPHDDAVPLGALLALTGGIRPHLVGRDAQRADRLAVGRLPEFRILSQVAENHHFV